MRRPPEKKPIDEKVRQRLARLEWLIDSEYEGSAAAFERGTGIKMSQVSQWFSGERALRDKALARLQSATSKPEGWFDTAGSSVFHGSHVVIGTGLDGLHSAIALKQQLVSILGIEESRIRVHSGDPADAFAHAIFSGHEPPLTLAQALEVVADALSSADDLTIDQVRPLLSRLVDEPCRAAEIVPRLSSLLSQKQVVAIETVAFAGKPKSDPATMPTVTAEEFVKR